MSVKILIVDDHCLMREGLVAIFRKEPHLEVVGQAANGEQALALTAKLSPEVILMDVGMQPMGGLEATKKIKAAWPAVHVLGLSTHANRQYVQQMLAAGASGYLLKASAFKELRAAIDEIQQGRVFLSPALEEYANSAPELPETAELAPRERQVLQHLAEGHTSKSIGILLAISTRTVEAHRRNIMRKLGLHSVADLTKYAIREGFTSLED